MEFGTSTIEWAGKPAPVIREIGEKTGSVLIIPVGSIEQHGQHMPVATDTILADSVARLGVERVEEDLPILKTPPVWPGHSPHHMSLGGTISLKGNELHNLLEKISNTVLDNDFDALLLLNGHGGNATIVSTVTSSLGANHPDKQILALSYFHLASSFIDEIRESDIGGMAHAGEFETSLMMHLRPELVQEEKMEANYLEPVYDSCMKDLFQGGPVTAYQEFEEYSKPGAIGDPDLSSAEKGEKIFERLGDELENLLREIHTQNK